MKIPKVWSEALERGMATTDMIDAAALAMHARALAWTRSANTAIKTLEKRPGAIRTRRRLEHATRMALKYSLMQQQLLEVIGPESIMKVGSGRKESYFLMFTLQDRIYFCPIDKDMAELRARKEQLNIVPIHKLHKPFYSLVNLPSLYTVLNIITTIHTHNIKYAVKNGNFDSESPDWAPEAIDWDSIDISNLMELGKIYIDAFSVDSGEC